MKLFAPRYYKKFACIADRCRHSCCIGWEIDIDGDTMKKYDRVTEGYGDAIRNSIEKGEIPHFKLCEDDRCPHLDSRGLCRIITSLGEGYLCHICREHPRFYNNTSAGLEAGLGLSCEEAARIILSSDGYNEMEAVGEAEGEPFLEFDTLPIRKSLFEALADSTLSYPKKLELMAKSYDVSPARLEDAEWRSILSDLEYLDVDHKDLFKSYSSDLTTPAAYELPLERTLAYFIYRHVTAACDDAEARAALGFSLFCERLICSVSIAHPDLPLTDIARAVSEELEYSVDNTEAIKLEFWF